MSCGLRPGKSGKRSANILTVVDERDAVGSEHGVPEISARMTVVPVHYQHGCKRPFATQGCGKRCSASSFPARGTGVPPESQGVQSLVPTTQAAPPHNPISDVVPAGPGAGGSPPQTASGCMALALRATLRPRSCLDQAVQGRRCRRSATVHSRHGTPVWVRGRGRGRAMVTG